MIADEAYNNSARKQNYYFLSNITWGVYNHDKVNDLSSTQNRISFKLNLEKEVKWLISSHL